MRRFIALISLLLLTACGLPITDLDKTPEPIGDFKLGFAVTNAADPMAKGPLSRDATRQEWMAALKPAFETRFKRFDGEKYYHIGVTAMGYVLAQPGVPLVLSPKSILIFEVVVIDDATQQLLTPEPEQFTIFERFSSGFLVGSGYTQTREEQIEHLSKAAAHRTEQWLREQPWFYGGQAQPQTAP